LICFIFSMDEWSTLRCNSYEESRAISRGVFSDIHLPDKRLNSRMQFSFAQLLMHPGNAFSKSFNCWSGTKGYYRFLSNPRVDIEYLSKYIGEHGARKSLGRKTIYAISDTTEISLPKTQIRSVFGHGSRSASSKSFFVHSTLSIDEKGLPLGILHQKIWNRDHKSHGKKHKRKLLPIQEKESFKWVEAAQAIVSHFNEKPDPPEVIMICDREGDIFEYIEYVNSHKMHAIVRSSHNRSLQDGDENLWERVDNQKVSHEVTFQVPRRPRKKKRKAKLTIRFLSEVELRKPSTLKGKHSPQKVSIIVVEEQDPPNEKDAIHWRLITTLPVHSGREAWEISQKYKYRWQVEEFHYILKSGCRIEKLQFEEFERYSKALVILSQVSIELLTLKYLSRIHPDLPASEILTDIQILVLKTKAKMMTPRAPPPDKLTIKDAVMIIGKMGGHLGRKCDGMPGLKVLWLGWSDLNVIADIAPELIKSQQ